LSTQADEVMTSQEPAKATSRKLSTRPHLVQNERSMTFEKSAADLALKAWTSDPAVLTASRADITTPPTRLAHPAAPVSLRSAAKRTLDIAGSLAIGLVFSPLILVIALRMRTDGGPVLFRHQRIGRDGKPFDCLKFRTMVPNAEQLLRPLLESNPDAKAEWLRDHKLKNDPRVTRLGRFLRKTSLDELPQLWNVLRGEMSLVGPRPIVREEMLRYGRYLRTYVAAKPGVTGLWQVMGRNDTDYRRRVVMDTYYVRKHTILMDLRILLRTVRVVIWGHGAY